MHRLTLIILLGLLFPGLPGTASPLRVFEKGSVRTGSVVVGAGLPVHSAREDSSSSSRLEALGLRSVPWCAGATAVLPGSGCALRDLDGDRVPDAAFHVVTGTRSSPQPAVVVRFSADRRDEWIPLPTALGGLALSARDVDGDDDVDLVLTRLFHRRPAAVLVNDGSGEFSLMDGDSDDADEAGPVLDFVPQSAAHAHETPAPPTWGAADLPPQRAMGVVLFPVRDRGVPAVPRKTLYCRLCRTRAP